MSPGTFLRRLCLVLALAGAFVWSVTEWVVIPWVVDGPSMEPTLLAGDCVLVDLWTFRSRPPHVGEIVAAVGPGDENLVKRIGPEPDPSADPYPAPVVAPSASEPGFVLLGDNPSRSDDSRAFGRIPASRIRGRVAWRYWPLSRAGTIE